jgi:hypothetical protein
VELFIGHLDPELVIPETLKQKIVDLLVKRHDLYISISSFGGHNLLKQNFCKQEVALHEQILHYVP